MENEAGKTVSDNPESKVVSQPKRLPLWVILAAFVLLIGFMALVGWGLNRSMQGSMAIGDPIPQFNMTTFDGKAVSSTAFSGKVVVLNFWASWCQPCEQEARQLEEASQFYQGKDVMFVGLAYVDTEPNSLAYIRKFGVTYPNGPDLATKISQMYRVKGVPETFIIDKHGKLAYFKAGPFTSLQEITTLVDGISKQ